MPTRWAMPWAARKSDTPADQASLDWSVRPRCQNAAVSPCASTTQRSPRRARRARGRRSPPKGRRCQQDVSKMARAPVAAVSAAAARRAAASSRWNRLASHLLRIDPRARQRQRQPAIRQGPREDGTFGVVPSTVRPRIVVSVGEHVPPPGPALGQLLGLGPVIGHERNYGRASLAADTDDSGGAGTRGGGSRRLVFVPHSPGAPQGRGVRAYRDAVLSQ